MNRNYKPANPERTAAVRTAKKPKDVFDLWSFAEDDNWVNVTPIVKIKRENHCSSESFFFRRKTENSAVVKIFV